MSNVLNPGRFDCTVSAEEVLPAGADVDGGEPEVLAFVSTAAPVLSQKHKMHISQVHLEAEEILLKQLRTSKTLGN